MDLPTIKRDAPFRTSPNLLSMSFTLFQQFFHFYLVIWWGNKVNSNCFSSMCIVNGHKMPQKKYSWPPYAFIHHFQFFLDRITEISQISLRFLYHRTSLYSDPYGKMTGKDGSAQRRIVNSLAYLSAYLPSQITRGVLDKRDSLLCVR